MQQEEKTLLVRKIDLAKARLTSPQANVIEAYTRKTLLGTMILDGNTQETGSIRPRTAEWKSS